MTFSICVRESYEDDEGNEQQRFGVAVTTRLAGVGTLCPFANEFGAVATQSLVNVDLGRKGIEYLEDGIAIEDALQALINADEGRDSRQLHGIDTNGEFAFSGEECKDWFGHHIRDGCTVAGNLLTGPAVIDATADTYEANRNEDTPLAFRLADALEAGYAEGGDRRSDLHVQSAAVVVTSTEEYDITPSYNDVRVDATETPIEDLQSTLELAREGYQMAVERYEDAYADDEMSNVD